MYFYLFLFQSGCEEENECQNGGKVAWDPVKPFKCQCPKNYFGELCEKRECINYAFRLKLSLFYI